ncbi:hypothetical protein F8S13_00075 [Chloroflexia bacterium SDU3-3]|nr:hypothetical protein F8S13_00075 [Chloroflexia bacterium SDU3-3]
MTSQSGESLPPTFPACPHCGARYAGNATTCNSCGKLLPISYTGPTQRLEQARPTLVPAQPTAPALPPVDPATEQAILAELERTGNHGEAARIVIDAYQCHWDVALQIVETIEQRHAAAQASAAGQRSPLPILIAICAVVLIVLLIFLLLRALA